MNDQHEARGHRCVRKEEAGPHTEEETYVGNCDCARVATDCVGDAAPLFAAVKAIGLQALKIHHVSCCLKKLQ